MRVLNGVSGRTALLVTEKVEPSRKNSDAEQLGTRTVRPYEFHVLLAHVQPALTASPPIPPRATSEPAAIPPGRSRGPDAGRVRQWALAQGLTVSARGRLPADLVTAYRIAHPGSSASTTAS